MTKTQIILSALILFVICCADSLSAQKFVFPKFKEHPPFREMKCGLWINAVGDIAYRTYGCGEALENENDTLHSSSIFIPEYEIIDDNYITWCYYLRDTNETNEDDDYMYMSELKNVVDTNSLKILSPSFFADKNYIYVYVDMACGGHIFVCREMDRKTFKVFKSNPDFACDKYNCFVLGREIKGADPKTFQPIAASNSTLLSRDKNHIYGWDMPMTETEIIEAEKEWGIQLRNIPNPKVYPAITYLKKISAKADSVTIATIYSSTKEDSLPYDDTTTKQTDTTYVIQSAKLTDKEIRKLNNQLNRLGNKLALPNHYDIEINYYLRDTIYSKIIISSITRNINILNNTECNEQENSQEDFNQTECLFRGKISYDMEKYLTRLLQKKKLWTKKLF